MTPRSTPDRLLGSFIGLAVGDALGTTLEFQPRPQDETHTELIGEGPFNLRPGTWTDDTSMSVAMATAFAETGRFDPVAICNEFVAWYKTGKHSPTGTCFDIGNQTSTALNDFAATGNPIANWNEDSRGNGSLMRLSPVVLFAADRNAAMHYAEWQSALTHNSIACKQVCRLFAAVLYELAHGCEKKAALANTRDILPDALPEIRELMQYAYLDWPRAQISSSGYVIHSFQAALWAFYTTDSFEAAVIRAANLGDDADTVAAIAGQIAGAHYGYAAIPERWLRVLAWHNELVALGEGVVS